MNDQRVLRRAQWWTLLGGAAAALVVARLQQPDAGLGLAAGSVWAAVNLRALEGLLTATVGRRERPRSGLRIFLWALGKLGVYVVAIWILIVAPFPVFSLAHGLTVMLAALVLAGLTTRSSAIRHAPQRGDDAQA
ncbi:MAG TPA: hypothetical protein PLL30_14745 [Candidatus Krumholzibacteria bacterium]|nr:hypothetical protein [Candidatus Krumholzibacteria bacterium]HPD73026.1 hypothetical protein [Candidatus Krumholzibacteria bacterium]HRY41825.1 hypothetical protein [Candidatus Krumholzibacteria bacterium]